MNERLSSEEKTIYNKRHIRRELGFALGALNKGLLLLQGSDSTQYDLDSIPSKIGYAIRTILTADKNELQAVLHKEVRPQGEINRISFKHTDGLGVNTDVTITTFRDSSSPTPIYLEAEIAPANFTDPSQIRKYQLGRRDTV